MSTDQGYRALVSYHRLLDGKTALYNMTDIGKLQAARVYPWILLASVAIIVIIIIIIIKKRLKKERRK